MICMDCPRGCGIDREKTVGLCGGGEHARIAKVINDFTYEEPCLGVVTAVFFGGCALKCSYCQNHKISRSCVGEEFDDDRLAALFDSSPRPLDLVTPTHFLSAIERAAHKCVNKPKFIYNTSGYETVDGVKRAAEFCDIFLADFKYAEEGIAKKYSSAGNYYAYALDAIMQMRSKPDVFNPDGTLNSGLIVRHLVLPGAVSNSIAVLDAIAKYIGTDVILSLMSQFTPNGVGEPNEKLKKIEYKLVVGHAMKLGFKRGYIQECSSANSAYTPDF